MVTVLMTFLMFLTPVLYMKPESGVLAYVTRYNPLYYLVSAPRTLVLYGTFQEWTGFLVASAFSCFVFIVCLIVFHLTETRIAERI
jgi:lipopolysaccharide transport system permease protein